MENFKNTIAATIIIGIALIIEEIFILTETISIISKTGKVLFNLLNYVESIVFVLAISKDLREYFKSKL